MKLAENNPHTELANKNICLNQLQRYQLGYTVNHCTDDQSVHFEHSLLHKRKFFHLRAVFITKLTKLNKDCLSLNAYFDYSVLVSSLW